MYLLKDFMPDYLRNWYVDLNKVKRAMSILEAQSGAYEAVEKMQQMICEQLYSASE